MAEITDIKVSKHGERRCRQRLGLPRRAVASTVRRAWQCGVPVPDDSPGFLVRLWSGARFVFVVRDGAALLVTVLHKKDGGEAALCNVLPKIKRAGRRGGGVHIRGRVVRDYERKCRAWQFEHGGV